MHARRDEIRAWAKDWAATLGAEARAVRAALPASPAKARDAARFAQVLERASARIARVAGTRLARRPSGVRTRVK